MSPNPDRILLRCRRFLVTECDYRDSAGALHTRAVVRHPGSVVVLPLLDDHRVCLIRNFRPAIGQSLIELPAGTLEPEEPPARCAARELMEETGLVAGQLKPLTSFYAAPGILDERMTLFIATHLTWHPPQRESGELIENLIVPWSEALEMVADGTICDAKTIVGLLLYGQHGERPATPFSSSG